MEVSIGILSVMLGCRSVGAAIGSIGSGVAVDRLVNHSYIFMSFTLIFSIASEWCSYNTLVRREVKAYRNRWWNKEPGPPPYLNTGPFLVL